MIETSFLLAVKALLLTVLIPLLSGGLLLLIIYPSLFKGWKFYILSWFLGIGVASNWLVNIQFVHFGIGVWEFLALILLLVIVLIIKVQKFGLSMETIKDTLCIPKMEGITESYKNLSTFEKVLTISGIIFVLWFFVNSFVHTMSFPSYADDTFWNRSKAAINIFYDGGVKMFGNTGEILGRGNLSYPIHIASLKALIASMMGGRHDVYLKLFQRIGLYLLLILSFVTTFKKSKNILTSIIPSILIAGLPLVFWHSIDGYHELLTTYYTILALRLWYKFVGSKNNGHLVIMTLMLRIACYMKNDGFVIYAPAVLAGFGLVLLLQGNLVNTLQGLRNDKKALGLTAWGILLFLIPYTALKLSHGLGFNPTDSAPVEWAASKVHWEIFTQFKPMFITENNYSIGLVFLVLIGFWIYGYYQKKDDKTDSNIPSSLMFIITPIVMFILFTAVFLFTENYQWVMNQTTSNRVYTMCFIVLFYFIWIIINELKRKK